MQNLMVAIKLIDNCHGYTRYEFVNIGNLNAEKTMEIYNHLDGIDWGDGFGVELTNIVMTKDEIEKHLDFVDKFDGELRVCIGNNYALDEVKINKLLTMTEDEIYDSIQEDDVSFVASII